MIIINKSGYLKYKNLKFRCALGKAGIREKSTEGDLITPRGTYKIIRVYYRKDRIKKITSKFKLVEIKKNMGWCDDPKSKKYNQLINLPSKYNNEKLYRKDNIYDLVLVLNYNIRPIVKNTKFLYQTDFPNINESFLEKNNIDLAIQISGKTKGTINVTKNLTI